MKKLVNILFLVCFLSAPFLFAQNCVKCHTKVTPGIVTDWQLSKHSVNDVICSDCHGSEHNSPSNVDKVNMPTPDVCGNCHETQVAQYSKGKHALGWAAMNAMPTIHITHGFN